MGRVIIADNYNYGKDVYKYDFNQKSELTRIHTLFGIGKSDILIYPDGQINDIDILDLTRKEVSVLKSIIKRKPKIRGCNLNFWNMCHAIVEYAKDVPKRRYRFLSEN